ncbi:hypothetical protein ACFXJ5_16305 [Streptomyces sp. NPDC059373]
MSPTALNHRHHARSPRSVEAANEAIRQYVAGRRSWSKAELAELDRLRAIWHAARTAGRR